MKNIGKLFLMFVIVTLYGCTDPNEGSTFQVYEVNPVSTYLETRQDDFSEWIAVLKYADLFNAINQASQSFTVFVPDNAAMREFYKKKGVSSIAELGKEYAISLAKFHIITDSVSLEKFIVGGKLESPTLSDDYLSVSFHNDIGDIGGLNSIYINNEALVKERAIEVSNGYVYVLGSTLTPLIESAYQRIAESPNYSLFKQILDATSWGDSINTIYDQINLPNGLFSLRKRNYTVLVVSDQAFAKDGIYTVADLATKLSAADNNYKSPENEMFLYAAYHVSAGSHTVDEFLTMDGAAKKRIWGTLADAVMEISVEADGKYYINYGSVDSKAQFVESASDVSVRNGIYHEIDGYLPLWQSETPVQVYFDFCDYPEVAAYIKAYGIAGQTYQQSTEKTEYRTRISTLSTYNLEMPSTPLNTTKYNFLDYFTVKESGSVWNACRFKDQLIINAGPNASVTMKSPVIIAGKYRVTLRMCYATSMAFIRTSTGGSNGGLMEFSFDGEHKIEAKPFTTITATVLGNYDAVLYEDIVFPKTGSHDFKIVIKDPAAGTNADFRIQLDYLLFDPIIE